MRNMQASRFQEHADERLAADTPAPDLAAPAVESEQLCRPSILIVDDDRHQLELHSRLLQSLGYTQVTTAASANEALLQLEHDRSSAELIICDLSMPEVDGITFLQILNASPFRGSVILLSGESVRIMHTVQKLLGGSQLTILGALTKPAGREAVRALIECWRPTSEATLRPAAFAVTPEDLHAANNERQWLVHYQPQIDVSSGALVGVEALVRWRHPIYGLVSPELFIPAAEQCGAIHGLTDFVVGNALQQQKLWSAEGLGVRIAVNVSMASLQTPDFWARFSALVRDAAVAPKDVTLEVTETRLMSFSSTTLENLVRLRMQHFSLQTQPHQALERNRRRRHQAAFRDLQHQVPRRRARGVRQTGDAGREVGSAQILH